MYHIGFVVEQVLGHITHGQNLQKYVPGDPEIKAAWALPAWDNASWAKRLPVYKSNWTIQAGLQARRSLATLNRQAKLDGLFFHTQVTAVLAQDWLSRIPGIVSLDATPMQYDALGNFYDHEHGPEWLERFKWRLNRDCFLKARKLVTWSDWARQSLIDDYKVPADKIVVIPPGVNTQAWARPQLPKDPTRPTRILFVGGNLERKGGLLLLEAFRSLRPSLPSGALELHMVTRDAVKPEPFLFVYNDMQPNSAGLMQLYHQCDIFCLPTQGDCLPMVLSEAGAAGLPVVSTQVAAIPEIVKEGETGFTIKPGDLQGLVNALRGLIENSNLRMRLGTEAQRVVSRQFDAEKNAQKLLYLIKQTILESQHTQQ